MKDRSFMSETFLSPVLASAVLGLFMVSPALGTVLEEEVPGTSAVVSQQPAIVPSPDASPALSTAPILAQALPSEQTVLPEAVEQSNDVVSLDAVTQPTDGMEQVTSVSQLTDVKPTDWAFQSLQSLVERYGCIVGYPDQTFRGNRALTRYEFAAGLNACLDRINELIAAGTGDLVKKEDLLAVQKLQEEFAAELATLR
ncbi:MAG TPA: iron uptake porin, partial [Candidatus Sericytochromatia bacterium]